LSPSGATSTKSATTTQQSLAISKCVATDTAQ
jgi:hypothetical protein